MSLRGVTPWWDDVARLPDGQVISAKYGIATPFANRYRLAMTGIIAFRNSMFIIKKAARSRLNF